MPNYFRRFGDRQYQLMRRVPRYDSKGRPRSAIQTKKVAELIAENYRDQGYNARVVNWVGGSGIYIAPRKLRVYNKSKDEAREQWMEDIYNQEYETAAFGLGQAFSNTARAGDPIESSVDAINIPAESSLGRLLLESEKKDSLGTLDDALDETGLVPVHSATPERMDFTASRIAGDMIDEVGEYGQIGWGPGTLPKSRQPQDMLDVMGRSRFRVTLQFEQPDGYGERPSYAFSTEEAANIFAKKLQELINKNGYYAEGGEVNLAEDVSFKQPMWIIPSDKISVDVVREDSGWVTDRADEAIANNPNELFQFGISPAMKSYLNEEGSDDES